MGIASTDCITDVACSQIAQDKADKDGQGDRMGFDCGRCGSELVRYQLDCIPLLPAGKECDHLGVSLMVESKLLERMASIIWITI